MDTLALLFFLAAIMIAFFSKKNVGLIAVAVGLIAVHVFGMNEKDLINGISASMFMTLVGITFLFAVINQTGALDLLARKIVHLAGNRYWLIPILIYLAGYVLAGVGPGAIPPLAIIPPLAVSIAAGTGYNPVMLGCIGLCGLSGGRMTPITPEAAIINAAAAQGGVENIMISVLVCQTVISIILSVGTFLIFKGHKVKANMNASTTSVEKFNSKQIIALLSIVAMLVLLIGFNVNIGLAALIVGVVLCIFRVGDDSKAIKALPWGTIIMVLGVGALLDIVDQMGGIDLMRNGMESIITTDTATPIMGVSAALLSVVSSALGVVYPVMMPMAVDIAESIGGNAHAMIAAVAAGGSLSGFSPLSTGGALILASLGTNYPGFNKEQEAKVFNQLLLVGIANTIAVGVVTALLYVPICNLLS